jgi:hypothetical protein
LPTVVGFGRRRSVGEPYFACVSCLFSP